MPGGWNHPWGWKRDSKARTVASLLTLGGADLEAHVERLVAALEARVGQLQGALAAPEERERDALARVPQLDLVAAAGAALLGLEPRHA